MKNIIIYLLLLFPWFLSGIIFNYDKEFYNSLNIPGFALPPVAISISWVILYILIAYSVFLVVKKTNILKNNDYLFVLIINYLSNMLFPLMFFTLKSPFLGFIITLSVFISSLYLFYETKKISKSASYFLIPYIIYNIYALILSFSVYIMNF